MPWKQIETEPKQFGGHQIPGQLPGMRAPVKTVVFVKRVWVPEPKWVQLQLPLEWPDEFEWDD